MTSIQYELEGLNEEHEDAGVLATIYEEHIIPRIGDTVWLQFLGQPLRGIRANQPFVVKEVVHRITVSGRTSSHLVHVILHLKEPNP